MTFRMLDSITVANLPPGADAYLGYVDGAWPTVLELRARFPGAHILALAVFPQDDAEGLDIENGDATIPQVYDWFRRQEARKVWRPVLYISAARAQSLLNTMAANGFARSSFRLLTAHYDAGKHICGPSTCGFPQADGTQWTDSAPGVGGSWIDESLLEGSFFAAPPKPPPPPKPAAVTAIGDDTMFFLPAGSGTITLMPPQTVQLPAGAWVAPTALRLSCSSPASFELALGSAEPATWQTVTLDYARSPVLVNILQQASGEPYPVLKLKWANNPATVTGDFA